MRVHEPQHDESRITGLKTFFAPDAGCPDHLIDDRFSKFGTLVLPGAVANQSGARLSPSTPRLRQMGLRTWLDVVDDVKPRAETHLSKAGSRGREARAGLIRDGARQDERAEF